MIDKDNLKIDESVGTFRWNDSIKLLAAPEWKEEFLELLPGLNGGWEAYIGERFQYTAKPGPNELVVPPHSSAALRFAMTPLCLPPTARRSEARRRGSGAPGDAFEHEVHPLRPRVL